MAIVSDLWTQEDVPASVLVAACIDQYGMEVFEWDGETIHLEIFQDYKVVPLKNTVDKIQAMITALSTDRFYKDFSVFESICLALSDDDPAVGTLEQANPEQMAWAVLEVLENDTTPHEWSEDVKAYVKEVLKEYGFLDPPEQLEFCNYSKEYKLTIPKELERGVHLEQKIKQNRVKAYIAHRKNLIDKYKNYL